MASTTATSGIAPSTASSLGVVGKAVRTASQEPALTVAQLSTIELPVLVMSGINMASKSRQRSLRRSQSAVPWE